MDRRSFFGMVGAVAAAVRSAAPPASEVSTVLLGPQSLGPAASSAIVATGPDAYPWTTRHEFGTLHFAALNGDRAAAGRLPRVARTLLSQARHGR